jgi:hypothetical protein
MLLIVGYVFCFLSPKRKHLSHWALLHGGVLSAPPLGTGKSDGDRLDTCPSRKTAFKIIRACLNQSAGLPWRDVIPPGVKIVAPGPLLSMKAMTLDGEFCVANRRMFG